MVVCENPLGDRVFGVKKFFKKVKKTLAICSCLLYDIWARLCELGFLRPFLRVCTTARYAMTREVAACKQPVFPLSMSDFKPGDKE